MFCCSQLLITLVLSVKWSLSCLTLERLKVMGQMLVFFKAESAYLLQMNGVNVIDCTFFELLAQKENSSANSEIIETVFNYFRRNAGA